MRQFKELSDSKRINVKPDRIHVRTTRTTDTLENALKALGVPNEKMKETALLNGGNLEQVISENTLLKVIEKGR
jgi:predicted Zn-dependent protease